MIEFANSVNSANIIPSPPEILSMAELFRCSHCRDMLPESAFFPARTQNRSRKVMSICKDCNTESVRERNYKKIVENDGIEALDELIRKKQKEIASALKIRETFTK